MADAASAKRLCCVMWGRILTGYFLELTGVKGLKTQRQILNSCKGSGFQSEYEGSKID